MLVAGLLLPLVAAGPPPAMSALAADGKAAGGKAAAVTVWHIPHPDDETLGAAGGILAAAARGERNIVVLYTQGAASDVRMVLNGVFFCRLHQRYHDPIAEGYEPLDVEAFKRARVAETLAALAHLGVAEEDVIVLDFPDGELEVDDALQVMIDLDRRFPGARHRTTSVFDWHRDHKNLARALHRLKALKQTEGVDLDVGFFRVYHYLRGQSPADRAESGAVRSVWIDDLERKRQALAEFGRWAPDEGRFAIGIHSVAPLFHAASHDPYEYHDDVDALPPGALAGIGRVSIKFFTGEAAVSYRLTPGWSLRVGAPYPVKAVRSALIFERPSVSASLTYYAGWGAELSREGYAHYPVVGVRIVDQVVLELRPPLAGTATPGTLQVGWRFDL